MLRIEAGMGHYNHLDQVLDLWIWFMDNSKKHKLHPLSANPRYIQPSDNESFRDKKFGTGIQGSPKPDRVNRVKTQPHWGFQFERVGGNGGLSI